MRDWTPRRGEPTCFVSWVINQQYSADGNCLRNDGLTWGKLYLEGKTLTRKGLASAAFAVTIMSLETAQHRYTASPGIFGIWFASCPGVPSTGLAPSGGEVSQAGGEGCPSFHCRVSGCSQGMSTAKILKRFPACSFAAWRSKLIGEPTSEAISELSLIYFAETIHVQLCHSCSASRTWAGLFKASACSVDVPLNINYFLSFLMGLEQGSTPKILVFLNLQVPLFYR